MGLYGPHYGALYGSHCILLGGAMGRRGALWGTMGPAMGFYGYCCGSRLGVPWGSGSHYGALCVLLCPTRGRCGSRYGVLWGSMGPAMGCSRALWVVLWVLPGGAVGLCVSHCVSRYGALWCSIGPAVGLYGSRYGALWGSMGPALGLYGSYYGSRQGALWVSMVTLRVALCPTRGRSGGLRVPLRVLPGGAMVLYGSH